MMVMLKTGITQKLKSYFKKENPVLGNNLTLKLFTNEITPTTAHTAASFVEATGGGYAAKTLSASGFTVSEVGGIIQSAYAQQQFVFTGPLDSGAPTIRGAYIVDADGFGICAELAPAPYTPVSAGNIFAVDPIFQESTGTPVAG